MGTGGGVSHSVTRPPTVTFPHGDVPVPLQSLDLHKPIDKRIYKGTQPTCHDFNQFTAAADTIALLVGFSAGQVQYLDLVKKDTSKLFNEEVSPTHIGEMGHKGTPPPLPQELSPHQWLGTGRCQKGRGFFLPRDGSFTGAAIVRG